MRLFKVAAKIAYAVLMCFEGILGLRFVLKMVNASSERAFTRLIYRLSDHILRPFAGIGTSPIIIGRLLVDVPTLIAIFLYLILALILVELIKALSL